MKLERDGKYFCIRSNTHVEQWTVLGKIPKENAWLGVCINAGNGSRFFREFTEDGEQIIDVRGGTPRQLVKELPKPKVKKEGYILVSNKDTTLDFNEVTCRISSLILYDKAYVEAIRFDGQQIVKVEWEE